MIYICQISIPKSQHMVQIWTISFLLNKSKLERISLLLNLMTKQPFQNINTKWLFIQKIRGFPLNVRQQLTCLHSILWKELLQCNLRNQTDYRGTQGEQPLVYFLLRPMKLPDSGIPACLRGTSKGLWKKGDIISQLNPATILSHCFQKCILYYKFPPLFYLGT